MKIELASTLFCRSKAVPARKKRGDTQNICSGSLRVMASSPALDGVDNMFYVGVVFVCYSSIGFIARQP